MMTGDKFSLDANILVYALDRSAGVKHDMAQRIITQAAQRDCVLTLQAIGEFFHAATRKGRVSREEAAAQVDDWLTVFPVIAADIQALRTAVTLCQTHKMSFWDALLLSTVRAAGCHTLLSEDMQDGGVIGGIAVQNPFGPIPPDDDLADLLMPPSNI